MKNRETPCQSDRLTEGYINCCVYLGECAISMHVYTLVCMCVGVTERHGGGQGQECEIMGMNLIKL